MVFEIQDAIQPVSMIGLLWYFHKRDQASLDNFQVAQKARYDSLESAYNKLLDLYIGLIKENASLKSIVDMLQNRNTGNQSYRSDSGVPEGQKVLPSTPLCG